MQKTYSLLRRSLKSHIMKYQIPTTAIDNAPLASSENPIFVSTSMKNNKSSSGTP